MWAHVRPPLTRVVSLAAGRWHGCAVTFWAVAGPVIALAGPVIALAGPVIALAGLAVAPPRQRRQQHRCGIGVAGTAPVRHWCRWDGRALGPGHFVAFFAAQQSAEAWGLPARPAYPEMCREAAHGMCFAALAILSALFCGRTL